MCKKNWAKNKGKNCAKDWAYKKFGKKLEKMGKQLGRI